MKTTALSFVMTVLFLSGILATTVSQLNTGPTPVTTVMNLPPVITVNGVVKNNDEIHLDRTIPFQIDNTVYTVESSDPDSDYPITHILISTYPPGNGYFSVDRYNGSVRARINQRSAEEGEVELKIRVSDRKGNSVDFILVLYIYLFKRPDITNLPEDRKIREDTPKDYVITTLSAIPGLHTTGIGVTWTLQPSAEKHKFILDSAGRFKLVEPLDFEEIQKYIVSFVLTDGYLNSKGDDLTIEVINVNEPPYFDEVEYFCSLDESDAGTSTCNIGAVVRDPEIDKITFVGFKGSPKNLRFGMSTSAITLENYDVDVQPDKMTHYLVARDEFGNETPTRVPVHITVRDVNDNTCTIPQSIPLPLSDVERPTKRVYQFTQYDGDKTSPNNQVVYDLVQAVPDEANIYFAVTTDGSVNYIEKIPEANNGKTYRLVVRCRDGGVPQRSAQGIIFFTYQISTTTSTTTTTTTTLPTTATAASKDDFDNSAFVAMFAIFMIALIVALLVGLYFLLRYFVFSKHCVGIGPTSNKTKIVDVSEYSNQSIVNYPTARTNMAYTDEYWKNGDNYETGNVVPSSSRAINGGFKRLALPAPSPRGTFNF